jgi:hypothetical protein
MERYRNPLIARIVGPFKTPEDGADWLLRNVEDVDAWMLLDLEQP